MPLKDNPKTWHKWYADLYGRWSVPRDIGDLDILDDLLYDADDFGLIIFIDFHIIKEPVHGLQKPFAVFLDDFFQFRKIIMDDEDIIIDIIAWLLFDQHEIAILDLRFHAIAFRPHEEARGDVLDA